MTAPICKYKIYIEKGEKIVKYNKKRKTSKLTIILLLLLIICGVWLVFRNNSENTIQENNTPIATNAVKEDNTKKEDMPSRLNNLKENEASFGDLDVPVYKLGEKDIKLPVLIYHGFCTPLPDDDVYKLMCTKDIFEDQITTLKDDGYTFITLEDIYKYKNGTIGLPEKNITITMDDGWDGNYTEAFELIKKHNVPATIFIVENLVGTPGYFSWEEAKEMYDSGLVKIHVHGRKHISATGYNKNELIEDYNHAHSAIEQALGTKVQKIMAYPAGDSSSDTIKWLKEGGFEIQVQTKYGTVNNSKNLDLTGLGRIRAERASGSSILKAINTIK